MSELGTGNLIIGMFLLFIWLYLDTAFAYGIGEFIGDICLLLGVLFMSNHVTKGKTMSVMFK